MPTETERKFLVKDDRYKAGAHGIYVSQGFLSLDKDRTVRVRLAGGEAFLTIKGESIGATRMEFEYGIPVEDAIFMLEKLCFKPLIQKTRYKVPYLGFTWEVDEFHGENTGLVVAEIELPSEDTPFEKPEWAGGEVTGDERYYNASLVERPFSRWR